MREFVRSTRIAQGLPPVIEDVATLDRVAKIFLLVDYEPSGQR